MRMEPSSAVKGIKLPLLFSTVQTILVLIWGNAQQHLQTANSKLVCWKDFPQHTEWGDLFLGGLIFHFELLHGSIHLLHNKA